ncbi:enoyl-CoA hydratase/isomerase family protein [Microbacterium sp. A93]|uniref:enoyl-CoA hydratase/isomerase family protein n=1 Tax=Microbacterium sp. A93 TaxID=3450716 RepID=UPI003F42E902
MGPVTGSPRRPDASRAGMTRTSQTQGSNPELVRIDQSPNGVARLTLARTAQRNAVNKQLADEVTAAVETFGERGVRIAIIDAEGPAFCAGADLNDLVEGGAAVEQIVKTLTDIPIHWTAVVSGAVRGAGLSILAACPRVLVTPDSTYGLPEISRGFFPTDLIGELASIAGARPAFNLAFRGMPISADAALSIGLVSDIVAADKLESLVESSSAELLAVDPSALRTGVELWQARARALAPS